MTTKHLKTVSGYHTVWTEKCVQNTHLRIRSDAEYFTSEKNPYNFIFSSCYTIPEIISKGSKLIILFRVYFKSQNYIYVSYLQVIYEFCCVDTFSFLKQPELYFLGCKGQLAHVIHQLFF